MSRTASIQRTTSETEVSLELALDGRGVSEVETGVGFLDHMLTLFAAHSLFDLKIKARGDLAVDAHHTTEDVGICLGSAISKALQDRTGIQRYGHTMLPMDETLVTTAIDISGRPAVHFAVEFPTPQIGTFDMELVEEFWRAVANHTGCALHVILNHGRNSHHVAEAIFKSLARSFRHACAIDPRRQGIPSTKGSLGG